MLKYMMKWMLSVALLIVLCMPHKVYAQSERESTLCGIYQRGIDEFKQITVPISNEQNPLQQQQSQDQFRQQVRQLQENIFSQFNQFFSPRSASPNGPRGWNNPWVDVQFEGFIGKISKFVVNGPYVVLVVTLDCLNVPFPVNVNLVFDAQPRNRSHPPAFHAAAIAGIKGSVRLARAAATREQA